ncbi:protein LSM12 [Tanacetum coccineum]
MDPSTTPPTNDDSFAIGTLLSLTTTFNETFECQVITYDRPSNILVLQEGLKSSSQSSRRNIRLLKANYIKEFTFLGQSADDPLDLKKCFLDLNSLKGHSSIKDDSSVSHHPGGINVYMRYLSRLRHGPEVPRILKPILKHAANSETS